MNLNDRELLLKMLLGGNGLFGDDDDESAKEIDKLAGMLAEANIPYKRFTRFVGAQVCYYGPHGRQLPPGVKEENCGSGVGAVCSVIPFRCPDGTYLLEISGLMTDEEYEATGDSVLGGLTAENVFQHIQAAMRNLMQNKTCFVIAHRLSTIRSADHILVLDGGKVVEQGTHESLMAARGFYYNLYQSQFDSVS